MTFFKHYTNAHMGEAIQRLGSKFGKTQGYGLYFLFVEFSCSKWDGVSEPSFVVAESKLRSFLGLSRKKLKIFLEVMQKSSDFEFTISEDFYEIKFPKLLEIKHRDSISSSQRTATGRPLAANINRKKNSNTGGNAEIERSFHFVWNRWPNNGDKGSHEASLKAFGNFAVEHGCDKAVGYALNYVIHYSTSNNGYPYKLANFFGEKAYWKSFVNIPSPKGSNQAGPNPFGEVS